MKLNGLKYKNMKRGRFNKKTYPKLQIKNLKLFHTCITQRDIDNYYSQSSVVFDILNDNKKNDNEKISEIENMITDKTVEDVLDDVFKYKHNRVLITHFIVRYNKQFYIFVKKLSLVDISRIHYLSDEDKIHCFELKERTMHDIEMAWRDCIRLACSPMIAKWCIKYHIGKSIPVDIFSRIFIHNAWPSIKFIEMFLEYKQCDPTCILQWALNIGDISLLLSILNHEMFNAKSNTCKILCDDLTNEMSCYLVGHGIKINKCKFKPLLKYMNNDFKCKIYAIISKLDGFDNNVIQRIVNKCITVQVRKYLNE